MKIQITIDTPNDDPDDIEQFLFGYVQKNFRYLCEEYVVGWARSTIDQQTVFEYQFRFTPTLAEARKAKAEKLKKLKKGK